MYITGKFKADDNFITVYANNKIYTLATNCNKNWASVSVGETADSGYKIKQEDYDSMKKECDLEGTFYLSEDGWKRAWKDEMDPLIPTGLPVGFPTMNFMTEDKEHE